MIYQDFQLFVCEVVQNNVIATLNSDQFEL